MSEPVAAPDLSVTDTIDASEVLCSLATEVEYLENLCIALDRAIVDGQAGSGVNWQDFDLVCQSLGDIARILRVMQGETSGRISLEGLQRVIRLGDVAHRLVQSGADTTETMARSKLAKAGKVDLF